MQPPKPFFVHSELANNMEMIVDHKQERRHGRLMTSFLVRSLARSSAESTVTLLSWSQQVIDPWQRVLVLDSQLIQGTIVNTHPEANTLFEHAQDGSRKR